MCSTFIRADTSDDIGAVVNRLVCICGCLEYRMLIIRSRVGSEISAS